MDERDKTSAQAATLRIILAMSFYQSGQKDEARSQLARGREVVESKFKRGLDRGNGSLGSWYDWVFARILLREAGALIEGRPPPADSPAAPSLK